jgi:hypothetical protein
MKNGRLRDRAALKRRSTKTKNAQSVSRGFVGLRATLLIGRRRDQAKTLRSRESRLTTCDARTAHSNFR